MASLKEIKGRSNSVGSTLKITAARKLVASAKLRKAQTAMANMLPYEQTLHSILADMLQDDDLLKALGSDPEQGRSLLAGERLSAGQLPVKGDVSRVALVVFSSDSSLCGAFNANVIRHFNETARNLFEHGYDYQDIDVYAIGRKAADAAKKAGFSVSCGWSGLADKPSYELSASLASELVGRFSDDKVQQVILIYNHFASTARQVVTRENYLPVSMESAFGGPGTDEGTDYILEPDALSLARELLPKVLCLKIYAVSLDANAAEHAARTVAMQIATDNATDLLNELRLQYNKQRQQAITSEILDLQSAR